MKTKQNVVSACEVSDDEDAKQELSPGAAVSHIQDSSCFDGFP